MKKISLIILLGVLYSFIELNAQFNWITSNFKTYLSNGLANEYVAESEKRLNMLEGVERENSYYVLTLFKAMSGYSNTRIPICQFIIATSALNLSMNSKFLNNDVVLNYCKVNDKYYYFLVNRLSENGVDVKLNSTVKKLDGGITIHNVSVGAPPFSVACFKVDNDYIDFNFESYRKINSLVKSPCFR
jgi:hypothetical protein